MDDHVIIIPRENNLHIPLQLNGIFSFFHTRRPTPDEIRHTDDIIFLTPDSDSWDPYSRHYAENEAAMLDWEGNMMEEKYRVKRRKLDEDLYDVSNITVEKYNEAIDATISSALASLTLDTSAAHVKGDAGERTPVAGESCAQSDTESFVQSLCDEAAISHVSMSLGAMGISDATDDLFDLNEPFTIQIDLDNDPTLSSAVAEQPSKLNAKFLSKIWHIKNDEPVRTLDQTTQYCRHGADNSLSRQYSTNDRMLRYRRINSMFFTDTFFVTKKGKSTRGNTCAQMFVSDKGFVAIYPMPSKSSFLDALKLFCKDIGVPLSLVLDPSGEQTKTEVRRFCHKIGTTLRVLQESTQWANRAELYIGIFKESVRQDLRRSNAPMVLWDYCAQRRAKIHNVTPKALFQLDGNNPHTATFGQQADISNLCMFDWYDWCYFREESGIQFPFQKEVLGRVLGPMRNEGNEMVQAILKSNGKIVPRRTCRRLTIAELHSPIEIKKRAIFDDLITKQYGDSITIVPATPAKPEDGASADDLQYDEDEEPPFIPDDDPVDATGKAVYEQPFTDMLLNAEVLLPQGEEMKAAKVIRRSKNTDGDIVGKYHVNPMLNTLAYDVEFPDGSIREYAANTIAMNMYAQVDTNGHTTYTLDSIINHSMDETAIPKSRQYVITKSGQRRMRKSTKGWKLLVLWKDGTEQWIPLSILKESNPIEVAEYAKAKGIDEEVAFHWWVPFTLRKRDRIISSAKARIKKATHKYGIEIPTSAQHALEIDKKNGNTYWSDAMDKEMKNVAVAFEILADGTPIPVGWTKSSGHLVFDVKMDFTRKARWVKDGHRTRDPDQSTYAGVVSRESVRIALTYAALNDIDVTACDIKNAYLQAPSSEKHYVICGVEFGLENVGKVALIRRALYGGKSSGADFWKHLRTCMEHLGFVSCKADSEIWMRPAKKDSGEEYWEYVLLYVDDALCISMNGKHVLEKEIGKYFYIKDGSVGPPTIYLGNKVSKVTLENGAKAWAFSSSQYIQNAVKNVEGYLDKMDAKLPRNVQSPIARDYRPEVDISPELHPREASHYMSLIGILRWIVELGRVDITAEVSILASCMALPREGHLEQLYHIFAYLKQKHNVEMVFDPSEPDIESYKFEREDWSHSVYNDAKEIIPSNSPKPRGFGFKIRSYVDSDHAGSEQTRRSRTGFIVFLNNAPVYWTSKKQGSIMTSSFGSEFIAMKECCEYLRGLRYKLRMMGIPCDFPSYIYGDNQSVLVNSTVPTSILKKKSCSIAYHFVREGVAADEWRITYISTHDNVADLLTKPIPGGMKRIKLIRMFLHHIT